jgi:predicted SnoaL-like aldol condensation-catalyzing enzyme
MTTSAGTTTGADAAGLVGEFLHSFFSGDITAARSLVRDDFTFVAPLVEADGTKEEFFAGADDKMRFVEGVRVVRQWQDGDDVSTIYEINVRTPDGRGKMLLHEWHAIVEGKLASSLMIFDTSAPAAELLHHALMADHD